MFSSRHCLWYTWFCSVWNSSQDKDLSDNIYCINCQENIRPRIDIWLYTSLLVVVFICHADLKHKRTYWGVIYCVDSQENLSKMIQLNQFWWVKRWWRRFAIGPKRRGSEMEASWWWHHEGEGVWDNSWQWSQRSHRAETTGPKWLQLLRRSVREKINIQETLRPPEIHGS